MFRKSIDIFLNLQYTDVLSASMLEELEAGAIVIKGDWLNYPDLEKRNVWLCSIKDMNALTDEITAVVENYDGLSKKTACNSGEEIKAVHMLPGYTHNIINLSETEPLITLMWANEQFDPGHPDTFGEPV